MGISRKTAARTTEEIVQALNTHQNNHFVQEKQSELENLIQRQRSEIQRLNEQISYVENAAVQGRSSSASAGRSRPTSGQLPPITSALTAHWFWTGPFTLSLSIFFSLCFFFEETQQLIFRLFTIKVQTSLLIDALE